MIKVLTELNKATVELNNFIQQFRIFLGLK